MDQIDSQKVMVGLCVIVILVIGINAGLFFSLRRPHSGSRTSVFSQLGKTARKLREYQPWEKEDQALAELSRQVADLKPVPPKSQEHLDAPPDPSSRSPRETE